MEGEASPELQDWEVLTHSDSEAVATDNPRNFEEVEADSGGMIRLDYFSIRSDSFLDDHKPVDATGGGGVEIPVESDNPSWVDPTFDTRYESKNSGGSWSDSGSDRSDGRKVSDSEVRNELGSDEMAKTGLGSGGVEEIGAKQVIGREYGQMEGKFSSCEGKTEVGFDGSVERQLGFEEFEENKSMEKDMSKFWSDSGGKKVVCSDADEVDLISEASSGAAHGNDSGEEETNIVEAEEQKQVVWWKLPFEVLRCCVLRVGPVWSFSMAAAVMGLFILGRKLYKMKRKARSIELKVTVDDKKVSQFMSRAARLNEAFSVVKRVPIIRPMLPAAGVNPWPVMSIR